MREMASRLLDAIVLSLRVYCRIGDCYSSDMCKRPTIVQCIVQKMECGGEASCGMRLRIDDLSRAAELCRCWLLACGVQLAFYVTMPSISLLRPEDSSKECNDSTNYDLYEQEQKSSGEM